MRHLLVAILALLLVAAPTWADEGARLAAMADKALVRILNDMEVLATLRGDPPLAVRIIRVQDAGECDGTPQSCPRQALYVAVSAYDENPDRAVYLLPKAHGWRFVEWTHVPERDGPDDFVRFTVERDDPAPDPATDSEAGWWTTTRQEVAVNPWKASIRPLGGNATP